MRVYNKKVYCCLLPIPGLCQRAGPCDSVTSLTYKAFNLLGRGINAGAINIDDNHLGEGSNKYTLI